MFEFKNIDVIILSGGKGRRLRSLVNDRPKPMAEINRRPFLEILISYLSTFGLNRFILSTGYKSDMISGYFTKKEYPHLRVSEERRLLGTGGAIKKNRRIIKKGTFLVINGDSFCKVNFPDFFRFHAANNAIASMVVTENRRNKGCGCVKLDSRNRVREFIEKPLLKKTGLVNCGIYLFQKEIFGLMPKRMKFSLEYDFLPGLIGRGFYGYPTKEILLDIGTPEGLKRTKLYFKAKGKKVKSFQANKG